MTPRPLHLLPEAERKAWDAARQARYRARRAAGLTSPTPKPVRVPDPDDWSHPLSDVRSAP